MSDCPSVSQSVSQPASQPAGFPVCPSVSQRVLLSALLLTICPLACLSVLFCLSVCLSVCMSVCLSVCLPFYVWSIINQPTWTFKGFVVWSIEFPSLVIQLVFTNQQTISLLPASLFLTWSKSLHRCLLVPRTDKLSYQRRTKTHSPCQPSREDPGNLMNAHLRRKNKKTKW